ncbi:hypothetical protein Q0Z83_108530 [Actinoplanes sichuanensis]|nr:hypothetical protein Q0Z83_108530 [Actinoplanes sichuanensis]
MQDLANVPATGAIQADRSMERVLNGFSGLSPRRVVEPVLEHSTPRASGGLPRQTDVTKYITVNPIPLNRKGAQWHSTDLYTAV